MSSTRHEPIAYQTKLTVVEAAAAAGQTTLTSDIIDMAGWAGCVFFTTVGAITSGGAQSIKAQQGAAAAMGDAADIVGSSITIADDDDGQTFAIDIANPRERYLRVVVARATQDSAFGPIYALQYGPRALPQSWAEDDALTVEVHQNPAEGTA